MAEQARLSRHQQAIWNAGTRAVAAAAAAYRVEELSYNPEVLEDGTGSGAVIGSYFPGAPSPGGGYSTVKFKSEVRARNIADNPPPEGAILRAYGFTESITGSTPSKLSSYQLIDPHVFGDTTTGALDPMESLIVNYDGCQYTLINLVGKSLSIDWTARKYPMYSFELVGQLAAAKTGVVSGYVEAAQSVSFVAGYRAVPCQSEGLTVTGHTGTVRAESIRFVLNPIFEAPADLNSVGGTGIPTIAGWDPHLILKLRGDLLANWNPFNQYVAGTQIALSWLHNVGATTALKLTSTFNGHVCAYPQVESGKGGVDYVSVDYQQDYSAAGFLMAWS